VASPGSVAKYPLVPGAFGLSMAALAYVFLAFFRQGWLARSFSLVALVGALLTVDEVIRLVTSYL